MLLCYILYNETPLITFMYKKIEPLPTSLSVMKKLLSLLLLTQTIPFFTIAQVYSKKEPLAHTFSIVARDEKTGDLAVAVQSHWFEIGRAHV